MGGVCLVPAAGVEPATFRSGGERSNPLSYAGLNKIAGFKEMRQNVPLLPLFVPLVNVPFGYSAKNLLGLLLQIRLH